MSYNFSKRSKANLSLCSVELQLICNDIIKIFDFSVICGHRGKEEQDKAYESGASQLKYPDSRHNQIPSQAIDVVPFPVDWDNRERFYYLAALLKSSAIKMGINLRWGGDWKSDNSFNKPDGFDDLGHFELVD